MGKFNMNAIKGNEKDNKVKVGAGVLNEVSKEQKARMRSSEFIKMDDIIMHEDNNMSMSKVQWLMQDIGINGLLQPLVVSQMADGKYKLYAGHQRFTALSNLRKEDKWGDVVEAKVIDLDDMKLPEGVSEKTRDKIALRSSNIQREKTDADLYVEIQDWKEIYAEMRANGVEVFEYGVEGEDGEETTSQQIKGVKTQKLVAQRVGISPAQVAKFEKVENQGADVLKEALKQDKVSVATANEIASMPKEEQEAVVQKALENTEEDEKITKEDILKVQHQEEHQDDLSMNEPVDEEAEEESGTLVTEKIFKTDIKAILKSLKTNEGIRLDEKQYSTYLKALRNIEKIVVGN